MIINWIRCSDQMPERRLDGKIIVKIDCKYQESNGSVLHIAVGLSENSE